MLDASWPDYIHSNTRYWNEVETLLKARHMLTRWADMHFARLLASKQVVLHMSAAAQGKACLHDEWQSAGALTMEPGP